MTEGKDVMETKRILGLVLVDRRMEMVARILVMRHYEMVDRKVLEVVKKVDDEQEVIAATKKGQNG